MYSLGNEIKALNGIGKEYFCFDSNVTEQIQRVSKEGKAEVFTCGEFIFNHYRISTNAIDDVFQFHSPAEILDIFIHRLDGVNYFPIMSCKDRGVRVLNSEGIVYQFRLTGNGECFMPFTPVEDENFSDKGGLTKQLIFGQADGFIVCYELSQVKETKLWSIYPKNSKAGVVCLDVFNFTKKGTEDIIVGRNDTLVEVYINMAPKGSSTPIFELRGSVSMEESITNIECAYFGPLSKPEAVVTTYSGKVFGVFDEESDGLNEITDLAKHKKKEEKELMQLQNHIQQLENKVETAYTQQHGKITINNRLDWNMDRVNTAGNRFQVRIDSQNPFEMVVIEKPKHMMLDYENQQGIMIPTPSSYHKEKEYLTIDYTSSRVNRLEFVIEPVEGISSDLLCYITPDVPNKFAQALKIPIKPLCSHFKISEVPPNFDANALTITGQYSASYMNNWLFKILPDISNLIDEEDIEIAFQSCTSNCFLLIHLETGKTVFKSQSVSTISILKQCISHYAAEQNIVLSMKTEVNNRTLNHFLSQMELAFETSKTLALQVKVIDALKEIENQENGLDHLSSDKKELLFNAEKIIKRNETIPKQLKLYKSMVVDLYKDFRLLKGNKGMPRLEELEQILEDFNKEKVINLIIS